MRPTVVSHAVTRRDSDLGQDLGQKEKRPGEFLVRPQHLALFRAFPGVPSGARSRNLLFHRQALCQLSYRHHDGEEWGGRVSRVLFPMVISLGPNRDRPRRHLRGGSRLPASASNLLAADSEIAAGRIALFTPAVTRRFGLCCSRAVTPRANLDCRRAVSRAPPRLSPGTRALCSSDFPLAPKRQRPSLPTPCLGCQCAGLTRGDG